MNYSDADLNEILRDRFEFKSFRPGQKRIIKALLAGRDVLALLPTGAGKSLSYQLTSQLLRGVTVVVSPLIALMKDQVESLHERGMEVSVVNSTQTASESSDEMRKVRRDEAKLLYVTPERFEDEEFMAQMHRKEVSLIVVDEAHCVSQWGHSFRPSYLLLNEAMARLKRPPVLALTATATPWVRQDIIRELELRDPLVVVRGTDRPNLFLEVWRVEEEQDEQRLLRKLMLGENADGYPEEVSSQLAETMRGSGIVYAATTKAAEETAALLNSWGVEADFYHGQRKKADRERVQDAFMNGQLRVIVATNAFGLGVDKPDIRFVVHIDIPPSLEAYYQEAGRAGRDGEFARCSLVYRPGDLGRAAFLGAGGRLTAEEAARGWQGILAHPNATVSELEKASGLSKGDLARLIAILEEDGVVEEKNGKIKLKKRDFDPEQISLEQERQRIAYEKSRVEMMRGYAETHDCRREYILNYFGEDYGDLECRLCDNHVRSNGDQPPRASVAGEDEANAPFAMGSRVVHESWGEGTVQRVTAESVTVLFESTGYKTLSIEVVQDRGLLQDG